MFFFFLFRFFLNKQIWHWEEARRSVLLPRISTKTNDAHCLNKSPFSFLFYGLIERFCTFLSWTSRQKGTGVKEEYRSRPPVSYHLSLKKKKKSKDFHLPRLWTEAEERTISGHSRSRVGRQWGCSNYDATMLDARLCELKFACKGYHVP